MYRMYSIYNIQNPFLPKRKKVYAKYLKTWTKFILFYSLRKNDVRLQKKKKTMSQVGVQKLGVPVFLQQLSYMIH